MAEFQDSDYNTLMDRYKELNNEFIALQEKHKLLKAEYTKARDTVGLERNEAFYQKQLALFDVVAGALSQVINILPSINIEALLSYYSQKSFMMNGNQQQVAQLQAHIQFVQKVKILQDLINELFFQIQSAQQGNVQAN